MNFAEFRFWELFLSGLGLILVLRWLCSKVAPAKLPTFDKLALVSLGLGLLFFVGKTTFLIFLVVAITTYIGLGWILKFIPDHRSKFLWILIPLQLLPLFFYKYGDFILNGVFTAEVSFVRGLIIPVGISFYTFQKVAFVVDTLARNQPLPRFLDYMNFAGFFPQIVAGPIERRNDLLPQMEKFRFTWQPSQIDEGATWIVLGLFFKCCMADNLARYFNGASATNAYLIWLANLLFGLRIYFDFAGYSFVALGLAKCLGIKLTLNFASPYCSTSITEFWRRWHITLSQWFRDYVYIPLGGNRTKFWAANLAIVFIISGIWHGAGWNFVFWGALHGLFLMGNRLFGRWSLPRIFGWALTLLGSFFAWLCFYETRTDFLFAKMSALLNPMSYQKAALKSALAVWKSSDGFVLACFLALALAVLFFEWISLRRKNEPYFYFRQPLVAAGLVVLTILLAPGKNNSFIYFAF